MPGLCGTGAIILLREVRSMTYDHSCFACGENNPIGLKLKFREEEGSMRTEFVPREVHQGYPGLMHGGLASTILDEAMSRAINVLGIIAVTARLEVRFRLGVPLNTPLQAEGRIIRRKGPLIDTEGRITLADGRTAVEATARFMINKQVG
jgi:acyl-coenzyme A thioesterase PaaI-like protein